MKTNYNSTRLEESNDDAWAINRSIKKLSTSMDKVIETYDIIGKSVTLDNYNKQVSPISEIDDRKLSPVRKNLHNIIQKTTDYNQSGGVRLKSTVFLSQVHIPHVDVSHAEPQGQDDRF